MEHRTALGIFLALAVNRPAAAFVSRASLSSSGRHTAAAAAASSSRRTPALSKRPAECSSVAVESLVDVDANLLHPNLVDDIDNHLQVALWLRIYYCIRRSCATIIRIRAVLARRLPRSLLYLCVLLAGAAVWLPVRVETDLCEILCGR